MEITVFNKNNGLVKNSEIVLGFDFQRLFHIYVCKPALNSLHDDF